MFYNFKWLKPTIITIVLTSFVATTYGFGFYLFSAIIPEMRADLDFSYTTVGIITGTAQASFMLFAIGGAIVAHRIGGAWVTILSMILCSACLLLIPVMPNIILIGTLLVIMGGCAASVYVPMVDLVSQTIKQAHRGKVLGLISSGTSYGVFINGMLIPVFLQDNNWEGIWLTVALIAVGSTLLGIIVFRRTHLFKLNKTEESTKPVTVKQQKSGGFFKNIKQAEPWVLLIFLITFLNGLTTLPFQNYLTPYLREELGFDVSFSGQVWAMIGFIGMFSGFLLGALSDIIGIRKTMLLTYLLLFLSAFLLIVNPSQHLIYFSGIFFALAFYPIFGLVPAYITKKKSRLTATMIFGIANVTLGIGGVLGNFLAGVSATQTDSFSGIYILVAILSVVLISLTIYLPKEEEDTNLQLQMK